MIFWSKLLLYQHGIHQQFKQKKHLANHKTPKIERIIDESIDLKLIINVKLIFVEMRIPFEMNGLRLAI